MANTETNKLPLVETYTVGPKKWFLPPAVRPDVGYSLQVFSPTGEYRGSVAPNGVDIRAREGDQVMRINLGRHQIPVSGQVTSNDGFERQFSLIAIAHVAYPDVFGVAYRQQSDPIAILVSAIVDHLMAWARQLDHNELNEYGLVTWAKSGGSVPAARIGVTVDAIEQPKLELSSWHGKARDIERGESIRVLEWITQANINQGNREEAAKDAVATRAETEANADLVIRIEAKKAFTTTMVNAYNKRLAEALADGITLAELRNQDPDFAAWHDQLSPVPAAAIAAPSSPPSGPTVDALPYDAILREDSGPRYIELLGVTCAPAELTDEQRMAVETQRVTPIQRVYVIRGIDEGGPGARCNLTVGDIILQVAGEHLPDLDSISRRLAESTPERPASIHICRGMDIYQATPEISH